MIKRRREGNTKRDRGQQKEKRTGEGQDVLKDNNNRKRKREENIQRHIKRDIENERKR